MSFYSMAWFLAGFSSGMSLTAIVAALSTVKKRELKPMAYHLCHDRHCVRGEDHLCHIEGCGR